MTILSHDSMLAWHMVWFVSQAGVLSKRLNELCLFDEAQILSSVYLALC